MASNIKPSDPHFKSNSVDDFETADSMEQGIFLPGNTSRGSPNKERPRTMQVFLPLILTAMLQKLRVGNETANGHYEFLQNAYDKLHSLEKVINKMSLGIRNSVKPLTGYSSSLYLGCGTTDSGATETGNS